MSIMAETETKYEYNSSVNAVIFLLLGVKCWTSDYTNRKFIYFFEFLGIFLFYLLWTERCFFRIK